MPSVYVGPILRRVDQASITVFIVSDSPIESEIDTEYLDRKSRKVKWIPLEGTKSDISIEIASGVHAHWLSLKLSAGEKMPLDTRIRYRLSSKDESLQQAINSQVALVAGASPHWIEFVSPYTSIGEHSLLIQMSCRSLANEQSDAILGVQAAIDRHRSIYPWASVRLLLSGDQIYTDEWSSTSIKDVVALAAHIGQKNSVSDAVRRWVVRGTPLEPQSGVRLFTSLEIISTYLLSWSPVLAEKFIGDKKARERITRENKMWMVLMATIPTYMMFDDHEVADDWNIDTGWTEVCDKSPVCQWLIGNAFFGCYLFQIIGNSPTQAALEMASLAAKECKMDLIGSPREASLALMKQSMSFVIPGTKEVAILDCRTKRRPYSARTWTVDHRESGAVGCLSHNEQKIVLCDRDEIERALDQLQTGESVVLVVNTPVFPRSGAERAQRLVGRGIGARMLDSESWDNFPQSWVSLADALMKRSDTKVVTILCGDVHYGFIVDGSMSRSDGRHLRVLQITSSPTKNYSVAQVGLPALDQGGQFVSACWETPKRSFESVSAAKENLAIRNVIERARKLGTNMHWKQWKFDGEVRFFRGTNFALVELGSHTVRATLCNASGESIRSTVIRL